MLTSLLHQGFIEDPSIAIRLVPLLFILFITLVVITHSCATSTSLMREYLRGDVEEENVSQQHEVSPETHIAKTSIKRRGQR